jgi:hypothetical protein
VLQGLRQQQEVVLVLDGGGWYSEIPVLGVER